MSDLWPRSKVHRPGGDRARTALQPRQSRRGGSGTDGSAFGARRHLGLHLRGRVHDSVSQERRSGRCDPALQTDRRYGVDEGVLPAEGCAVSDRHVYTPYHPRWLRQPVSTYWWMEKWSYFRFILRESTCMFVAWGLVYLLMLIRAVSHGATAYAAFVAWSARPWVLA